MLFPNITAVPIPDPLTVSAVVGVVTSETIGALIGFSPCIGVNPEAAVPITIFSEADCPTMAGPDCEAEVIGSAPPIAVCAPADVNEIVPVTAVFEGPGAGNLEFFVLQPDPANPTNILQWPIVGVTEWQFDGVNPTGGGFDFATAAPGQYALLPLAFTQMELDQVTFNPIAGGVIGAEGGESLAELVALFPNITAVPIPDPLTVEAVLGVVTSETIGALIGFSPCVAVNPTSFLELNIAVCDVPDCEGVMGGPALPGTTCDDGNADTINDVYQADCSCAGIIDDTGTGDPCITIEVDTNTMYACSGESICVQATVENQGTNDVTAYLLHTDPTPSPDNIVAQGVECEFSLADIAGGETNITYYVSAVASTDDNGNGLPDFGEACFTISSGGTAVFLDPIVVDDTDVFCDEVTLITTINYIVTGGLPGFDNTQSYTLSGDVNTTLQAGIISSVEYTDGALYTVTATDGAGCSGSASGGPIECVKLPSEFQDFYAEQQEDDVLVTWTTSSEIDSDFFELERSRDGQTFETVYFVDAAGSSTSLLTYTFLDTDVSCGSDYFYRINQVDFNGQNNVHNSLARIETASCGVSITSISPVPADDFVNINLASDLASKVTIQLFDITGKILELREIDQNEAEDVVTLDVSAFSAGIYFVSVSTSSFTQTSRLIVR